MSNAFHSPVRSATRTSRALRFAALLLSASIPVIVQAQSQAGNPVQPATDGNGPHLDYGANGTPVVKITTPNQDGTSYNRYQQFNIDGRGVVLNNAERVVQSKLAGYIDGNANLKGTGGASLIINEVVAANPSRLTGYLEVAGKAADVVLANPYGISCDGCGFINTARVALAAGATQRDAAGNLTGFAAPAGTLAVNGRGLDASLARLDLFARAIEINAGVYADEIKASFGTGTLDAKGDVVTVGARAATAPLVGLDVAVLGGMYARSIKLVGTEQGLGVRVAGELAGLETGVSLSANGKVSVAGTISGKTTADITTADALDVTGQVYAGQKTTLAAGGVTGNGLVASGGDLSVTGGAVASAATFAAGLSADGKLTQAGNLTLTSGAGLALSGSVLARDGVTVASGDASNRGLISGANVTLRTGALDNSGGTIDARTALDLGAANTRNRGGIIQSAGTLTLSAAELDNQDGAVAALGTGLLKVNVAGTVGGNNGQIGGNGDVDVAAGALLVSGANGKLTAARTLVVNAGNLVVAGGATVASNGAASVTSRDAVRITGGALQSSDALTLKAATIAIDATGQVSAARTDATATGAITNAGLLGASGRLGLTAGTLTNTGTLVGEAALDATVAGRLAQSGRIASGGDIALRAGELRATGGTVEAGAGLTAVAQAVALENATLLAYGTGPLAMTSTDALATTNSRIGGNGDVTLSGRSVAVSGGNVTTLGNLSLTARDGNLTLTGNDPLAAAGDMTLSTTGTFAHGAGDLIGGGRSLTLTANRIENRGGIRHGGSGALTVTARDTIDNQGGTLASGAAGATFSAPTILNQAGTLGGDGAVTLLGNRFDNGTGTIASGSDLTVNVGTFNNAANGQVWADRDAKLTVTGALANRGTIAAARDLILASATIDGAGGTLAGGRLLSVHSGSGSLGKLVAPDSLTLGITGDLTNAAGETIDATGTLTLDVGGAFTNFGTVSGGDAARVTTGGNLINQGGGTIKAPVVTLRAGQLLDNQGLINGADVSLSGAEITNSAAIFGDRVALDAGRIANAGADAVIATRSGLLSLASNGEIVNRDGASLYSLGAIAITGSGGTDRAAALRNLSASIQAQGDILIAANEVVNDRASFSTEEAFVSSRPGREQVRRGDRRTTTTYTETVTETRILTDSGPGRIIGGNILIDTGSLTNNISTISAAGNLTIAAETKVTDTGFTGYDTTTQVGTILEEKRDCDFICDIFGGADWKFVRRTPFTNVDQQQKFVIPSTLTGRGTVTIDAADIKNLTLTPSGATADIFAASASGGAAPPRPTTVAGSGIDPDFGFAISNPTDRASGGAAGAVLAVGGLFRFADASAQFLIQGDSRFTNYNDFVSSDIFVSALGLDPARIQLRLGDGLYEQQLITNQLVALTGSQRLSGYGDNQAQYRALLEAGATYARAVGLGLGVALSAEQVATLTSDIVVLVETTVQTPSGPQRVLAPKIYLTRASSRDVTSGGAVIAGHDLILRGANSLTNAGVIRASATSQIGGGDITNTGRLDLGSRGLVSATGNLTDHGGVITGGDVTLAAGRDIRLETVAATRTIATRYYGGRNDQNIALTTATTNRGSAIGASGDLQLLAGGSVSTTGATIAANGNLDIAARDGIVLGSAVDTTTALTIGNQGKTNFRQTQTDQRNVVTNIQAGGNATLATGGELALRGASVDAAGALTAQADRIDVQGVIDQTDLTRETRKKSGGFLSSTKTTTSYNGTDQTVVGSTLAGDTVALGSVGGTRIAGSNVVAENGVSIAAGGALDVTTMAENDREAQSTRVKKSGLSIGGGGLFLGVAKNRNDVTTATTTNVGSLVGSTAGDVTLDAGRALSVTSSRVVGTGTTSLTGESIAIRNATDVASTDTLSKSSSVGISVGVNSPVLAGVQGVRDTANIIDNRNANDRTVAVAGLAGGLAAYNGVDALKLGGPNLAKNIGDTGSLSVTFGMSKSKATSNTRDETTAGSYIAGNDVFVTARGAGPNSTILVQGSEIAAARDATLSAPGAITLRSATETDTLAQANKSSGFSAGVQIGLSGGVSPIGSLNLGKGSASGSDVQYAESVVSAGRDLTIRTGDTLTLQGALARGERVAIDAGNLAIITQQDTASYRERQRDINLSAGAGRIAGNLTSSRQQGDYASVREQSGIFAGSGGYDIAVAGDTRLVGGVIASDAAVAANRLRTGTLSATDLANRERYSASSLSVGGGLGGIGKNSDGRATVDGANPVAGIRTGLGTLSATPPVALGAKGSQSGTTYSAIAPGTIAITSGDPASQAALATLRRDPTAANAGAIVREYNDAKREEIALGFAAATQLSNQTGTFFANRAREEENKRQEAAHKSKEVAAGVLLDDNGESARDANGNVIILSRAEIDQRKADVSRLTAEAKRINDTYGAGSPARIIATALNGAAGSNVTGSMSGLVQAATVNVLQSLTVTQVKKLADAAQTKTINADGTVTYTPNTQSETIRTALQSVVGCAGAAAGGGSCTSAAVGAGAGVVINYLLTEFADPQPKEGPRSLEDQEARKNLTTSIVASIASATGIGVNAAAVAAQIETENNDAYYVTRSGLTLKEARVSLAAVKRDIADSSSKTIGTSKQKLIILENYIRNLESAEVGVLNLIQQITDPTKRAEMMALPNEERTRLARVYAGNPTLATELVNASPAVRAKAYEDIADHQKNGDPNWLTWAGSKVVSALGLDEKTAAQMYFSDLRYRVGESELHQAIASTQQAVTGWAETRRAEIDKTAEQMRARGGSKDAIDAYVRDGNIMIATAESTLNSVVGTGRSSLDTLTLAVSKPSLIATGAVQSVDAWLVDGTPLRVYIERGGQNWDEFKKMSPAEQGRVIGNISGKAVAVVGGVIIAKKFELPSDKAPNVDGPDVPKPDAEIRNPNKDSFPNYEPDANNGAGGGTPADLGFANGGHLIKDHVGWSEQQLIDRANGPKPPAGGASSYATLNAAEYYTNAVITANQADIIAWLSTNPKGNRAFSVQDLGQSTGRWVPKAGAASQPVKGATVVIRKNPNVPRGYDVITGYPCHTGLCSNK